MKYIRREYPWILPLIIIVTFCCLYLERSCCLGSSGASDTPHNTRRSTVWTVTIVPSYSKDRNISYTTAERVHREFRRKINKTLTTKVHCSVVLLTCRIGDTCSLRLYFEWITFRFLEFSFLYIHRLCNYICTIDFKTLVSLTFDIHTWQNVEPECEINWKKTLIVRDSKTICRFTSKELLGKTIIIVIVEQKIIYNCCL